MMRTPEQKGSGGKNDAYICKADNQAHEAICESEYHRDTDKNVINADKAKGKPKSKSKPGKVIEDLGKDLG